MAHQRPILRHRSPPAAGRDAGLDHPATTDREPDGAPRTGTGGPRTAGRAPDSQEVPGGVWDSGPMNDASQRHADRYGGPLVSRRTSRVLLAVAAAVFLAVVVYVGMQASNTPVRSEMLAYEHVADDVIAVDYQVTMDPGTEATCTIQALNKGRAQVGFVETEIPAQETRSSAHHIEISTQGEAVSAEIVSCTAR